MVAVHSLPSLWTATFCSLQFRRSEGQDVTFDSRQQSAFPQTLHTMTTSNDTAQPWRDLADQFTAAQITQLERLERDEPQTLQLCCMSIA